MSAEHEALYDEALEAIQRLFGDTSVSQEQTMESFDKLASEIEMSIEVIKEDLRRERG